MASTTRNNVVDAHDLTLGGAIRLLRERAKMSARNLSLAAGLSDSYVGKVEKGEIEPSLRAFARIAHQLGLSAREVDMLIKREAARSVTPSVENVSS